MFPYEGIVSELSHHPEGMWVPCNVWFLLREQWIPFAINPIFMICGSACPRSQVQWEAAQLHNTFNASFKVSMGNATCRLSNLFLLNYAPLWQIICRLHARWREFSVSASGLVNITVSSQGYLLIPDGTRCALCIFLPICGAYFFPRNESALIFYTFFLFLCQYMRVSWQNKQRLICIYTRFTWNKKKKKENFIPLCLFNSKLIFPVTQGFLKLRAIIAQCLLIPLLSGAQPSHCLSQLTFGEHYEICVRTCQCLWNTESTNLRYLPRTLRQFYALAICEL